MVLMGKGLTGKRQILLDAIGIGFVNDLGGAEGAAALRAFAREQVAFASARPENLARGRNFKTFGHRLLRLNSFWSSHTSFQ